VGRSGQVFCLFLGPWFFYGRTFLAGGRLGLFFLFFFFFGGGERVHPLPAETIYTSALPEISHACITGRPPMSGTKSRKQRTQAPKKMGLAYTCLLNQPMASMYSIFTYIWLIFMVNVGKYTIHGWYGQYHQE